MQCEIHCTHPLFIVLAKEYKDFIHKDKSLKLLQAPNKKLFPFMLIIKGHLENPQ